MTRLAPLALAALLLPLPALAQEADTAPPAEAPAEEERGLIGRGTDMLLRGLIEEIRPPMEELAGIAEGMVPTFRLLAQEMGPAFVEVMNRIDSIENYEPPAILPNGDILLRRRADAPAWEPPAEEAPEPEPGPGGEVEL